MQRVKLVVVGDSQAGITELLTAYTNPYGEDNPLLDHTSYNVMLDGRLIDLDCWDTSEQDDSWRHLAYSQTQIFIILFSVSQPTTFQNVIERWLPDIVQYAPEKPILLVGNHMDTRTNFEYVEKALSENSFPISVAKGKAASKLIGAVDYLECSTNSREGITNVFETAMRAGLSKSALPTTGFLESYKKLKNIDSKIKSDTIHQLLAELANNSKDYIYCNLLFHIALDYTKAPEKVVEEFDNSLWLSVIHEANSKPLELTGHSLKTFPKLKAISSTTGVKFDSLNVSHNLYREFPSFSKLKVLKMSHNMLTEVPNDLMEKLPKLEILDISYNLIDKLPPSLTALKELNAIGNPLSTVPPSYRSKDKLITYLKMLHGPIQPWNRIKLMLVGHEGVGKTTFLRALRSEKYDSLTNISTNGINISSVQLSPDSNYYSSLLSKFGKKDSNTINCDIWDFGGQTVFHSTHRFFMTSNSLYIILYDMTKPESRERLKYWLEQIGSLSEQQRSKPVLLVGTHSDMLSKQEKQVVEMEIARSFAQKMRNQVEGHFCISLTKKTGLNELKAKIFEIALSHPKIGIGKAMIPTKFVLLQREIDRRKQKTPYLWWGKYATLATSLGIPEDSVEELTTMLHDAGQIVWHNVGKLRDMVILNPQWLADALASVVSFIFSGSVSRSAGMISWGKISESLKLKFDPETNETIVGMLEYFEIVYRIRAMGPRIDEGLSYSQMFFVPSLLSSYVPGTKHPGLQYYEKMIPRTTFIRRFIWPTYPPGFVSRLLLRIVHLRLLPLACWMDYAVVMGRFGDECALLELIQEEDGSFCLEIKVKVEGKTRKNQEPLVSELAYLVMRLHKDTTPPDTPIIHAVVILRGLGEEIISYEDCLKAETQGKEHIEIGGEQERISEIVQDMSGFHKISHSDLTLEKKLAEGGYGVVFKGYLRMKKEDNKDTFDEVPVAVKRIKENDYEEEGGSFLFESHDFQHEIFIMSKLKHANLVQLLGITISPLQMVLEYVPCSNLHDIQLERVQLTLKWKLKFAIDCACGVEYLHSQTPAICHSDLRAPNLFVNSMEENDLVIAKVADFGLSQHIFPFAKQQLYNITETAPETWYGGAYNEKSDVYSFAIILWRLFGSWKQQFSNTMLSNSRGSSISISLGTTKLGNSNKTEKSQTAIPKLEIIDDDPEFYFLKKNGKDLPPSVQRDLIRKGGRPSIHETCPQAIRDVIEESWKTAPDARLSFSSIKERLLYYYENLFGKDEYVTSKQTTEEISFEKPKYPLIGTTSAMQFKPELWSYRILEGGNGTFILELPREIWVATTRGTITVMNKQDGEILRHIKLAGSSSGVATTTKVTLLLVRENCVWAHVGSIIHVISTKTKEVITAPLSNIFPITSMVHIPKTNAVWVADTHGYITIWDSQTLLQCYQFSIHSLYFVHMMVFMNDYVWMAVGRELLVINTETLLRALAEPSHRDKIQSIVAVPHANQVWTCTKSGNVAIYEIAHVDAAPIPITPISPSKPQKPYFPLSSISPSGLSYAQSSYHLSSLPRRTRAVTLATSHSYNNNTFQLKQLQQQQQEQIQQMQQIQIQQQQQQQQQQTYVSIPSLISPPSIRRFSNVSTHLPNLMLEIPEDEKVEKETFNTEGTNFSVRRKHKCEKIETQSKYACLMLDGSHVCIASLAGDLVLYNIKTREKSYISVPEDIKGSSIVCVSDCTTGLYCSIESSANLLMYHTRDKETTSQT